MRIVVLGYIVRGPVGGLAWHYLQYAVGLAKMGHDVVFLEVGDQAGTCYDPSRHTIGDDPSYGLCFASDAFDRVGLGERWAYFDQRRQHWVGGLTGPSGRIDLRADVVLNISGVNVLPDALRDVPLRVLIDTDPGFLQVRHLTDPSARENATAHNRFYTFAGGIEDEDCRVPDDGFSWHPTRQPVVLDLWPRAPPRPQSAFTTLMQWESYPGVMWQDLGLEMKSASFERIRDLPARSGQKLSVAMGGASAPRSSLEREGWVLTDPLLVSRDPWTYQDFIADSKGEFSVAKDGYVVTRSGWFSERSAAYLATGRPVVVEDTGFSKWLPTGDAVFPFSDVETAREALDEASTDYPSRCTRAREVAGDVFGHTSVLNGLLNAL
jgi:hypothetical protein